jgi:hypothetical protein
MYDLDKECDYCFGNGKIHYNIENDEYIKEGFKCDNCNGTGYILTCFGQEFIDFLKRHKDEII